MRRSSRVATALAVAGLSVVPLTATPSAAGATPLRSVMFVGNNWAGTASMVDAGSLQTLRSGIDLVPDQAQELTDIYLNPVKLAQFLVIRYGPGEGHDQLVDDMFTTPDGRFLAVSRPSFADVVWIDIAKAIAKAPGAIVHEEQMDGFRTDHMGLSPDGQRLLVSDSTSRTVHEYAMADQTLADGTKVTMGQRLRTFESGETPHESNFSKDGSRIFHASIGRVYTPGDDLYAGSLKIAPLNDAVKGDRWFEIVRNSDFAVTQRWDMGRELAEAGHPDMSSAVRPMAIAPGERFIYFQVSYFHGLVEFDTQAPDSNGTVDYQAGTLPEPRTGAVTRVINLPNRVPTLPLQDYVNDSAHHGLAIDTIGKTLCAAGTMDDYVALVDRASGSAKLYDTATTGHAYAKPYWTTEGPGNRCWISLSEADSVAVVDFATGKELAYFPVGDHPQRIRHGWVLEAIAGQA